MAAGEYSLDAFGRMIADNVRMNAYRDALRASVREGSIVVDIGAGTGILSLLACQFGASRVYAVDPNPVVELAAATARDNGFGNRVVAICGLSTELELDEKADVVVSDIRGVLPPLGRNVATIADARARLLKPAGALIPQRDRIWAAIVSAPESYAELTKVWGNNTFDLDLRSVRPRVLNAWRKERFTAQQLRSAPALFVTWDYSTLTEPTLRACQRFHVSVPGSAHGLALWFDTVLFDGIGFSNAPDQPPALYSQAFFPWLAPVELLQNDTVTVEVESWLVQSDYVWRWRTSIMSADGQPRERFEQSTFFGASFDLVRIHRGAADFVPRSSQRVRVEAYVLSHIDGRRSLAELGTLLQRQFPDAFPSFSDALGEVARISRGL